MNDSSTPADRRAAKAEPGLLGRRPLLAGVMGAVVGGAAVTALPSAAAASRPAYEVINPADIAAPLGFSHGIAVEARRTVLLAGQVGQKLDGSWEIGVVAQYERALRNLLSVVRRAGGKPRHLVSLTIFVTDLPQFQAHYDEIQAVWQRLVGPNFPAQAVIAISALWFPEALMEIQGTAALFD